jgi:hypothetical protein
LQDLGAHSAHETDDVRTVADNEDEEATDPDDGIASEVPTVQQQGPGKCRYPGCVHTAPDRLVHNVQGVHGKHTFDHLTVKTALQLEDWDLWVRAINAELISIVKKHVYD